MPLSRRETLTALGCGVVVGGPQGQFERAPGGIQPNGDVLQSLQDAFHGFQETARILPPRQLIDGMTGNVAILDGLRRRASDGERNRYGALQAHYAEGLSWLSEEAGDLPGAMWWLDRASHWAQAAGWTSMTAKQVAAGYALAGNRDESRRALDTAMDWLAQPVREGDAVLSQLHVVNDDLLAIYQTTCDAYLGYGARVVPMLEPRLESLAGSSFRGATITRAKLARAYANAGQPEDACRAAWETFDAMERIDSQSARSELRRALPILNRCRGRSDIQRVVHRLG